METTAEQLLEGLMVDADPLVDASNLLYNIKYLHRVDDRFIPRTMMLVASGNAETREDLRTYLNDQHGMPRVRGNADRRNLELGTSHNIAIFVLEMVTFVNSVTTFADSVSLPRLRLHTMASFCDRLLIRKQVPIHPDVAETSPEGMDRYYHPLSAAAHILKAHSNEQRFLDEAPEFITWAGQQEDMSAVLSTALRLNTLNTTTVEAITRITKETEPALRNGVL